MELEDIRFCRACNTRLLEKEIGVCVDCAAWHQIISGLVIAAAALKRDTKDYGRG